MIALSRRAWVCTADMVFLLEQHTLHWALMDFWKRPTAVVRDLLLRAVVSQGKKFLHLYTERMRQL